MTPDDPTPSPRESPSPGRSYSPGGNAGQPDITRVRRAGTVHVPDGRGPRRGRERRPATPVFIVSREIVVGVLLLLLVIAVAGGLWFVGLSRGGADRKDSTGGDGADGVTASPAEWQGPHPSEVVDRFTAARTHAERLKWVRQPDKVGAAMEAFFRDGPGAGEKIVGIQPMAVSGNGAMLYEDYLVQLEGGGVRLASVSVDPAGAKVDFPAYARQNSESWDDLLGSSVMEAEEVRVILRPGGYYLHAFPDEEQWRNFKASTPDLPEGIDLYAERGTALDRQLAELGEGIDRMTLSIRAVGDSAKHRQFQITGIKSVGWVLPEDAD
jgi:hypothetical protein